VDHGALTTIPKHRSEEPMPEGIPVQRPQPAIDSFPGQKNLSNLNERVAAACDDVTIILHATTATAEPMAGVSPSFVREHSRTPPVAITDHLTMQIPT
jgi:hypothetical protein